MAETTCVLLVFCIPAIPKAFKNSQMGLISYIAQSVRSWTRITTFGSRRQLGLDDQSWLPSDQDSLQQQSIARRNKTHRYPAGTTKTEAMSLEDIKLVKTAAIQSNTNVLQGQAQQPGHGRGILRTTEVLQKKEDVFQPEADGRTESPYFEPQNSWIQR